MSNPDVVSMLIEIILRYDLILIHEIRDSSEQSLNDLVTQLNTRATAIGDPSGGFKSVVSARLGRTDSKEQYGILYRDKQLRVTGQYQFPEESGIFERPPFVVRFESPSTEIGDFAILALHTKPSQTAEEIGNITMVYDIIRAQWNLQDVLVAGDLNADCTYLSDKDEARVSLFNDPRFMWLISDDVDTTTGDSECSYDRFIAAGVKLQNAIVPYSAQVLKFDEIYQLSEELTLKISDHYPIEVKLAGKANIEVQSKVEKSKSVDTKSKVPASSVYRLRDLYNQEIKDSLIPDFVVTVLKEGTRQALIIAEKEFHDLQTTEMAIAKFHFDFPELVTSEMVSVTKALIYSNSFDDDYVYGLLNLTTRFKMVVSCDVTSLLCTLRIEKYF